MSVKNLTVGLRHFLVCPCTDPVFGKCWTSSVTPGSPGQQNCFQTEFWVELVRKGKICISEKGKNLYFWERGKFVLAELNMSFWLPPELFCLKRGWIPRNPSHSTILAHWWSSVCHRGSFIAIATCLFWCRPSNLWAYWFRPADVQFTYSQFSPFVGLKNTSFKK